MYDIGVICTDVSTHCDLPVQQNRKENKLDCASLNNTCARRNALEMRMLSPNTASILADRLGVFITLLHFPSPHIINTLSYSWVLTDIL